jgi:hypothetical protein
MEKFSNLMFVILILTSTGCQKKVDKENENHSNINPERMVFAKNLSINLLTAQKNGSFYALSEEEADVILIHGLNEVVQKESYKEIKNLFGDYKDLKFESLVEIDKAGKYEIYRFRGTFGSSSNVEIRAVLNSKGKLAGFFVKPWNKSL